jgi:hypothetical protein
MVQTFIYSAVMYGAEGTRRRRSKTRCQRSESSPALHPRDCSSDVLGLGYSTRCFIDAAKLCWQHRCQNMEAGRWPARRCDHSRVAGVGRPKGTDWCGNVKSITEQIQHTLNIAKVTAQARVNQPCVGSATAVPRITDAVRSQTVTHRMMTMTSRR